MPQSKRYQTGTSLLISPITPKLGVITGEKPSGFPKSPHQSSNSKRLYLHAYMHASTLATKTIILKVRVRTTRYLVFKARYYKSHTVKPKPKKVYVISKMISLELKKRNLEEGKV